MVKKNYYEILGVKKTDSIETIKKSYRKLALKFHPDKACEDKKKDCEESFKEINEAYSILSDKEKRRKYDSGETDHLNRGSSGSSPHGGNFGGGSFGGGDFSDILRNLFNGGNFEGRFSDDDSPEQDLRYELTIEFKEAAFGCEKEISLKKDILCNICKGTGSDNEKFSNCFKCEGHGRLKVNQRTPWGLISQTVECPDCEGEGQIPENKCKHCKGSGIITSKEKFKIKIPCGIDNGQVLRVNGGGNAIKNGSRGDLFLNIRVKPDKVFTRKEFNIFMKVDISFSQAALGGEISIPTLSSEEIKIKISKGTESGSVLRLKGRGIPFLDDSHHRGDQFVNIIVKTPKKLSKAQIKLFEELAKLD